MEARCHHHQHHIRGILVTKAEAREKTPLLQVYPRKLGPNEILAQGVEVDGTVIADSTRRHSVAKESGQAS